MKTMHVSVQYICTMHVHTYAHAQYICTMHVSDIHPLIFSRWNSRHVRNLVGYRSERLLGVEGVRSKRNAINVHIQAWYYFSLKSYYFRLEVVNIITSLRYRIDKLYCVCTISENKYIKFLF